MYFNEINTLDQYSVEWKVHVLVFYRLYWIEKCTVKHWNYSWYFNKIILNRRLHEKQLKGKFPAWYTNIRVSAFRCLLCKVVCIYIMYAGTWQCNHRSCDTIDVVGMSWERQEQFLHVSAAVEITWLRI